MKKPWVCFSQEIVTSLVSEVLLLLQVFHNSFIVCSFRGVLFRVYDANIINWYIVQYISSACHRSLPYGINKYP